MLFDPIENTIITDDNVTLKGKTGFPSSAESEVPFQSGSHYIRLKGKTDLEFGLFIYSYTKEGWYRRNTAERVNNVQYWY